ncbi:cation transport protein ChaC [Rhizobium sp. NFR07]|uniref:gamma-glutamylcyclotransferase n=1 Tax=Rhizobium sp. NFR07 TaxID=1566262 RepID=UPI0008E76702|nr:gamma-glutamylcyclotransferase [Rhizobium sp. NFR07]SFB24173.1 cation transport protein ChaC [Rhizobium sp. NFR07]
MARDMDEFWVFGYGSLMWNPGFPYVERQQARIHGFRRCLCVWSVAHRGTEKHPGLVMGLDRGGSCLGVAFRVADEERDGALDYLRKRELITNVYQERLLPISLPEGRRAQAVTYVVDRRHDQYAGHLEVEEAARIVLQSHGQSGPNDAYVLNTVTHMKQMGIRDHWLEAVGEVIKAAGAP